MEDQETRQNTSQYLNDSTSQASYSYLLPRLHSPPNSPLYSQQGTTRSSQKQLPTVNHPLTSGHSKQIQSLPRTSGQHQNYQQSSTEARSYSDLVQLSRLPTSTLGTPTILTAQESPPPLNLDNGSKLGSNEQFTDKTDYQRHARSDHGTSEGDNHANSENHQVSESRLYVCTYPDCGKGFKQQGNLKTHERKHTGARPYQCPFDGCEKTFAQMGNLKTHEKIHWLVKPYLCDYPDCNRGFTQRGNLKAHLIKVHHQHVAPS